MGAVRGNAEPRNRLLPGPVQRVWKAAKSDVAIGAASGRHRSSLEALVAAADDRLLSSTYGDGQPEHRNRSGPLHRVAGASARLQTGRDDDSAAARTRSQRAGSPIRYPDVPR